MLRLLIGVPVLLVLILFALSNRDQVTLSLWPTDVTVQTPMAIAILAAAAGAFIIGALFTWFSGIGHRRRARRSEATIRLLEEQVAALKARPMAPAGTALARLPER